MYAQIAGKLSIRSYEKAFSYQDGKEPQTIVIVLLLFYRKALNLWFFKCGEKM